MRERNGDAMSKLTKDLKAVREYIAERQADWANDPDNRHWIISLDNAIEICEIAAEFAQTVDTRYLDAQLGNHQG